MHIARRLAGACWCLVLVAGCNPTYSFEAKEGFRVIFPRAPGRIERVAQLQVRQVTMGYLSNGTSLFDATGTYVACVAPIDAAGSAAQREAMHEAFAKELAAVMDANVVGDLGAPGAGLERSFGARHKTTGLLSCRLYPSRDRIVGAITSRTDGADVRFLDSVRVDVR